MTLPVSDLLVAYRPEADIKSQQKSVSASTYLSSTLHPLSLVREFPIIGTDSRYHSAEPGVPIIHAKHNERLGAEHEAARRNVFSLNVLSD